MEPRFAPNYLHFTRVTPRDTKTVHPRTITCRAYDQDIPSLVLAMVGLALMVATTVSMLVAFSVL